MLFPTDSVSTRSGQARSAVSTPSREQTSAASPESTRSERVVKAEVKYFFADEFADQGAGEIFMAVMPPAKNSNPPRPPKDIPAYLAHLWKFPVLQPDQEQHCFRKLNYLRYLLAEPNAEPGHCAECRAMTDDRGALEESIHRIRNFLVESNLRLVVSIAKRHASPATDQFEELVCIGNAALMRAVDLFDFRRGTRFSTYAYQAIERSIYGVYRSENRYRTKITTQETNEFDQVSGDSGESLRAESEAIEAKQCAQMLIHELDDRDRLIVKARFGIDRAGNGAAFHVIAKEIKLSTTRTVQLFNRSMVRLRELAAKRSFARGT